MKKYTVDEMIGDLLDSAADGVSYWARSAIRSGVLRLVDREDPEVRATISPADVRKWAAGDGPGRLADAVGDPYQKAAVIGLGAGICGQVEDLFDIDWDEETADVVVQWIALGGVIYG